MWPESQPADVGNVAGAEVWGCLVGCRGRLREGACEQTGRVPGFHGVQVKDAFGEVSVARWCVRG